MSLVKNSRQNNDITVVSVFVNPTQFNNVEDLKKYPRTIDDDMNMLESGNVDILFLPEVEDIYPDDSRNDFDLGDLDKVMEGEFRPGHFKGVADVVYRLFNIVKCDNAYFGEKDYQQIKIIQHMVEDQELDVVVNGSAIVRGDDGLALSSRNVRLTEEQRIVVPNIYRILSGFVNVNFKGSPQEAETFLLSKIDEIEHLRTEYVSIVEDDTMNKVREWTENMNYRICVAVWCGDVRLIDNFVFVKSNNC
jgi:pantoate--beta-alanine ligase